MADNVYALLQQAWSVSKTADANMYGVEVAIVTNVKDPDKQGRVKICFPRLPGKPESDWARVAQPSAGPGRGFYWLPEVSDEVLVAFERGQSSIPYVIGALWNGKDKPMKDAYTADNSKRMIQTKSGHQIVLDDKSGEEKITIGDGSGKRTLTFDVKDKKFLIEAKEGDVEIHSKKKLVLECEDLEIKTSKTGKITIGTTFDLKVADKASFKAGPKMELKATKVNLNPPSLSIAALVTAAMQAAQAAAAAAAAAAAQQQQQQQAAAAGAAPGGPATVPTSTPAAAGAPAGKTAGKAAGAKAAQKAGAAAPAGAAWTTTKGGTAAPGSPPGGAPTAAGSSTAAPGPAAPVAADQLDVQVVDAAGKPQENLDVQVALPGGDTKTGRTDASGHFKLTGLTSQGSAKFELTGVQVRRSTDPAASGRVQYLAGGVQALIGALTVVELPQKTIHVLEVEDALFRTDSAVLLPDGQDPTSVNKKGKLKTVTGPGVIAAALRFFDEHPEKLILVAGHTDTVSTPAYNLTLSELRAACVQAVLTGDRDQFGTLADQRHKVKDYQQILSWASKTKGWSCDPGPIDGVHGDQTSKAVRGFKSSWNQEHSGATQLDADNGQVKAETWKAFFDLYEEGIQAELGSSSDGVQQLRGKLKFTTPNPVGCGESHPIDHLGQDNYESQTNRRVEILFFDPDELPDLACHAGACNPKICQVYDLKRYLRTHLPPLVSTKFWSAGWELDQVQENQSDRMILNAPGLPAGTPLDFEVLQKDNAGGADIPVGTLSVSSTADHGESAWSSWFTYERNDIRKGHDFKFVFVIRGGGRVVRSAAATIFHPTQLQLRLVDGEDKPLFQRRYRLEIDGQALRDQTDAQGTLLENIRGGATEAQLVVGDGQPLWTVPVKLVPMQGAETVVGAQMRLNNLGLCSPEAVHGNLDAQTQRALQRFQELYGIPVTGQLDGVTVEKLRQVHDS